MFGSIEVDCSPELLRQVFFQNAVEQAVRDGESVRLQRLATANKLPEKRLVTRYEFVRNPNVVAQVLHQAQGKCNQCRESGPFLRNDGTYFLEVHHIQPLSQGGEDSVKNAEALCPNCHRERHYRLSLD